MVLKGYHNLQSHHIIPSRSHGLRTLAQLDCFVRVLPITAQTNLQAKSFPFLAPLLASRNHRESWSPCLELLGRSVPGLLFAPTNTCATLMIYSCNIQCITCILP